MSQARITRPRISLLIPDGSVGEALCSRLREDARVTLLAHHTSLNAAYGPTEADPPDVIFCSMALTKTAEFPMFGALAKMIEAHLVALPDPICLSRIERALNLSPAPPEPTKLRLHRGRVVAMGASTGGIEALRTILRGVPPTCPPIVIVQHIKHNFLDGLVRTLDRMSSADIRVANPGDRLTEGTVFIAPGVEGHLEIDPLSLACRITQGPAISGHRPSIDHLFQSLVPIAPRVTGVLLTGMGRDGASGLGELRRAGATTIAQDAASSTVYGMPRVAHEEGAACQVLPLDRIASAILDAGRVTAEHQT